MPYVIGKECFACHTCKEECPVSAIDFIHSKYEIDPEKCTGCGHCALECPISAITDTDAAPAASEPHEMRSLQADCVVIGAGGSGLIAAVKAARETGKKFIVLEAGKKPGGNTNLAHGFHTYYSQWQKEAGSSDKRNLIVRNAMRSGGWRHDEKLVKRAIYSTGPFFDWLCSLGDADKYFSLRKRRVDMGLGPESSEVDNDLYFPNRSFKNLKSRDQSIGPGWAGTYIIVKMLEQCEELNIGVLTEHRAVSLLTDDTGKVCGVIADDPGGQTRIDCDAVMLATGCFTCSDEKMRKYAPAFFDEGEPVLRITVPTNQGDAFELGAQVGADIPEDFITAHLHGPVHHPFTYSVYRIMMSPELIFINMDGKRWIDESSGTMMAQPRFYEQPGGISYFIADDDMVEREAQRLIADPPDGNDDWILRDYRKDIEYEVGLGFPSKRADTLEGLAIEIGVDPKVFMAEIEKYNKACEQGEDSEFFKDPKYLVPIKKAPFYGFLGKKFTEGMFGGVRMDYKNRVQRKDLSVIEGLFAAGDCAPMDKHTIGGNAGMSDLTWALTSGYMAGESIADYLMGR